MKPQTTPFQAFDDVDPPSIDLIKDCVHCGFCLSACPTYLETGNELDSPRGRIYLMKSAAEGKIPLGDGLVKHLDLCLGCLACETACPSGVHYGALIENARSQIERRHKRPFFDRLYRSLLFSIFPYSKRLKLLLPFLFLYQASGLQKLLTNLGLLPDRLARTEEMLPEVKLSSLFSSLPEVLPAKGQRRYRVAMLTGCVQSVLFPQTNEATARVLVENGCEVVIPKDQGCCGALSIHSGRLSEGRDFARKNVDVFAKYDVDAVIVNSAGCGSSMKEYGWLLKGDPDYSEVADKVGKNTKDIMEFLSGIGLQGQLKELKLRVTYQDACHIVHAQRIKNPPRAIIKQIPGIELVELPESELCCGSAGIYNMVQPEMSQGLLERKLSNLMRTHVDYLVAGNPGCLLQIQKGINEKRLSVKTVHPVDLLDWSYRGIVPK